MEHHNKVAIKAMKINQNTGAFNEILESDRLKTEVMVLRTKVKTLSDKLMVSREDTVKIN